MNNSQRVIVNTIAQYVRTVVNILLSLYTVRIILDTLGVVDYGIYSLVAGVTAMLAFMTNALVTTTQRYMSYYQGKGDVQKMKEVFSNSEFLHLFIGAIIVMVLLFLTPLLFNGFLNVPQERIEASKLLYVIIVVVLFVTFCTAPFRALLISHENILYISIVDIVDGILKLAFVLLLAIINYDHLIVYGLILLLVQLFNLVALGLYAFAKYEECITPKLSLLNKTYFKELSSFSGWVIYGTGCAMARTQGIAIVVNKYLSTIANASYGLGLQISGAISTVSTALLNAMRPQIVKEEGAGNHKLAMELSFILCKFSFYLMAAICIPCVVEMPRLLSLWLKEVPEYAVLFARMSLIAGLVDSLTLGLSVTNEAIGNVKQYNLVIASLKLLALPLSWFLISILYDPIYIAISFIGMELVSAFVRLPFLKKTGGLNIKKFLMNITLKELLPILTISFVSMFIALATDSIFGFIANFIVSSLAFLIVVLLFGLTAQEKQLLKNVTTSILKRK